MDSQGIEKVQSEKEAVGYEEYLILSIKIQYTEGIDDGEFLDIIKKPNNKNLDGMRIYRAFGGIGRGLEFCTPPQQGFPDPSWIPWNMTNTLPLNQGLDNCKYLYVEVMQHWSRHDPGTSTGNRIVGRAAIPIPKQLNQVIHGRYGLVRKTEHGMIANGHIFVAMELKKIGMSCDADYNDNNRSDSSSDDTKDSSSDDKED